MTAASKKATGLDNRDKVREWALKNPFGKIVDCSRDLGLSTLTVWKHAQFIKSEMQQSKTRG
jgi:hypothetical protein